MKKNTFLPLVIIFSLFSSSVCKKQEFSRIGVLNDSNRAIAFFVKYKLPPYPTSQLDTTFIKDSIFHVAFAHSGNTIANYTERKKGSDSMSFFILSLDTVKVYSWDKIKSDYKVLKRYDLSKEDLKKLNWKIRYPPTPEMRHIKQFPAYGE